MCFVTWFFKKYIFSKNVLFNHQAEKNFIPLHKDNVYPRATAVFEFKFYKSGDTNVAVYSKVQDFLLLHGYRD